MSATVGRVLPPRSAFALARAEARSGGIDHEPVSPALTSPDRLGAAVVGAGSAAASAAGSPDPAAGRAGARVAGSAASCGGPGWVVWAAAVGCAAGCPAPPTAGHGPVSVIEAWGAVASATGVTGSRASVSITEPGDPPGFAVAVPGPAVACPAAPGAAAGGVSVAVAVVPPATDPAFPPASDASPPAPTDAIIPVCTTGKAPVSAPDAPVLAVPAPAPTAACTPVSATASGFCAVASATVTCGI